MVALIISFPARPAPLGGNSRSEVQDLRYEAVTVTVNYPGTVINRWIEAA